MSERTTLVDSKAKIQSVMFSNNAQSVVTLIYNSLENRMKMISERYIIMINFVLFTFHSTSCVTAKSTVTIPTLTSKNAALATTNLTAAHKTRATGTRNSTTINNTGTEGGSASSPGTGNSNTTGAAGGDVKNKGLIGSLIRGLGKVFTKGGAANVGKKIGKGAAEGGVAFGAGEAISAGIDAASPQAKSPSPVAKSPLKPVAPKPAPPKVNGGGLKPSGGGQKTVRKHGLNAGFAKA